MSNESNGPRKSTFEEKFEMGVALRLGAAVTCLPILATTGGRIPVGLAVTSDTAAGIGLDP